MTTATGQFLMFAAAFALAYLCDRVWRFFFPDGPAEEYGYAPGSEAPPWGWPVAIALGLIVVGLILFGPTMAARIIGL